MKTVDLVKNHIRNFETKEKAHYLKKFLLQYKNRLDATPASDKGFYAMEGGLVQHIDDMIRWMQMNAKILPNRYVIPNESMVITACLHDLFKMSDGYENAYYIPNILQSTGKVSPNKPYSRNKCYRWGLGNNMATGRTLDEGSVPEHFAEIAGDIVENFGLISATLVARASKDLWNLLSASERRAICYSGMANNTNKYNLQGKVDPLMILVHSADMLSMYTTISK